MQFSGRPRRIGFLFEFPASIGKFLSQKSRLIRILVCVKEYGSFLPYLEQIAGERKDNHLTAEDRLPTVSKESVLLSKDMKRRGFLYLGPVILYSYLQAVGLVDDHLLSCPFHGIE